MPKNGNRGVNSGNSCFGVDNTYSIWYHHMRGAHKWKLTASIIFIIRTTYRHRPVRLKQQLSCFKETICATLDWSRTELFKKYIRLGAAVFLLLYLVIHDDVIKWKHFPRYWSFVRVIHRSPVNSPLKGQWRGALMFSLICVWNGWVNDREAGDLRRYRVHYDVIVMFSSSVLRGFMRYAFNHIVQGCFTGTGAWLS